MSAHSDPRGDNHSAAEKPNASAHRLADVLRCECTQARVKLGSRKATLDRVADLLTGQVTAATDSESEVPADAAAPSSSSMPSSASSNARMSPETPSDKPPGETHEELTSRAVFDALLARERLGSTALGEGVAIPHCRLPGMTGIRAALITLDEGVDFDAPDGDPVDLLCCLIVGEEEQDHHLKLLSQLAQIFSDAAKRRALRAEKTKDGLYRQLLAFAPDSDGDTSNKAAQ